LKTAYDPLGDGISSLELLDQMGGDLSVVNAARVSFGKRSEEFTDKDAKLIRYLINHKHGTPFEHVTFQFRVRAPLFVVHQWERHRVASYNEESGRYIELRPDFYIKPGQWADRDRDDAAIAYDRYQAKLADGVPKEDARMQLPVSLYKEFWWTVNARSLMNFIELRADSHAQWEIRRYAEALEDIFSRVCPHMAFAFCDNGRKAP
jgi:thymidylate synthase (FAD)